MSSAIWCSVSCLCYKCLSADEKYVRPYPYPLPDVPLFEFPEPVRG